MTDPRISARRSWEAALGTELMEPVAVTRLRERDTVFPPVNQVFRAFELTPYDEVRAVILGQDPYHGPGQADGLAFSVSNGSRPAVRKIHRLLELDCKVPPPPHRSLAGWASQGVLLLNTTLTVTQGKPASHRGLGWEQFTDGVIEAVCQKTKPVVFLLWGRHAREKAGRIREPHLAIEAAHPTSRANANDPFLQSHCFSRANEHLRPRGINWADM